MTLKIERQMDGQKTVVRLVGRLSSEHLGELESQTRSNGSRVALDLDQVTLVDVEAVRFLGECRARGIELLNCSPYIKEWMRQEQDRVT